MIATDEPLVLTEKQLIEKLRGYALERKYAYERYSSYSTSQKLEAIAEIIDGLERAQLCKSSREAVKLILRTTLNFHFIAPKDNKKAFATWYKKIEACMEACRQFLNITCQFRA